MKYFDELKRSMDWLAQDPRVLFLGQAVEVPGTAMTNTLKDVPREKLLEMPVDEELQMGMTTGLLLATNQLVSHLDKISVMSRGGYAPKAIIRTSIGAQRPLHPSHQHVGDYTEAFRLMCHTVEILRLDEPDQIFPAYEKALLREDGRSTLIVEWGDYYSEK